MSLIDDELVKQYRETVREWLASEAHLNRLRIDCNAADCRHAEAKESFFAARKALVILATGGEFAPNDDLDNARYF